MFEFRQSMYPLIFLKSFKIIIIIKTVPLLLLVLRNITSNLDSVEQKMAKTF